MGRLGRAIAKLIEAEQPDIVNLQEVISYKDGDSVFMTSIEEFQHFWEFPDLFFSPMVRFNFLKSYAQFGNAILSRLPIESTETIFTSGVLTDNFNFEDHDYNVRNFQHSVIDKDGTKIHILNHHGYHVPDHKNGTPETDRQMLLIADYIDKLEGPIILSGDFNLSPKSSSLAPINDRLRNLSVENNLTTTRNRLTNKREICDYIFVNDTVKVNKFEKLDAVVSDHAALTIDFDV